MTGVTGAGRKHSGDTIEKQHSGAHLQGADMEDGALGRVGALVENPPVQQHVLRMFDVDIDGVAAHSCAKYVQGSEASR